MTLPQKEGVSSVPTWKKLLSQLNQLVDKIAKYSRTCP